MADLTSGHRQFYEHRETKSPWSSERKTQRLLVFDGQWISSRTDGLARMDLPLSPENTPCSVCGRTRWKSSWLSLTTGEVRCKTTCFTPEGRVIEYAEVKKRNGKVVSRRVAMLR